MVISIIEIFYQLIISHIYLHNVIGTVDKKLAHAMHSSDSSKLRAGVFQKKKSLPVLL